MLAPLFQGTVIRNEPASRSRPVELAGYHKFSDGQFDAFVARTALEAIAKAARQAAPNEMIGFLVGRAFRDWQGVYAIVTEAIVATSASCGPVTVETSLEDERRLLETLRSDYPIADKLGWFHSHPFFMPSYSTTDRENQRFWNEPFHLGLLACLDRAENVTIFAFRGPESEPIGPPFIAIDSQTERASASTIIDPRSPETAERRQSSLPPASRWSDLGSLVFVLGVIWPIVFLTGIAILAAAIRQPTTTTTFSRESSNLAPRPQPATRGAANVWPRLR